MVTFRYFEAHLAVKTEQVKQALHGADGGAVVPQQLHCKVGVGRFVGSIPGLSPDGSVWLTSRSQPYSYSRDQVIEMMEFLIECGPPRLPWEPVEVFYKLSCVPLMLQLVSAACDWKTYYGR